MLIRKLKNLYLIYSLSVWCLGFLHLLVSMVLSIPTGKIIINFNHFGEFYFEFTLLLIAIPGIYILLQHLWEIIVVEGY